MESYYRILLGRKNLYADECYAGEFVGVDFQVHKNLGSELGKSFRDFSESIRPIYLESHSNKSRVSAGLACGALYTVAITIQKGDIILCRTQDGDYRVAEVAGDYYYAGEDSILPHRRPVRWIGRTIRKDELSDDLRNSCGGIGTISSINQYALELRALTIPEKAVLPVVDRNVVEDMTLFALEQHLEEFLVRNWAMTELGKNYDIFEEDGEVVGQQYLVDTGRIDILAQSKDRKEILIIELKRGRASDIVVGQILRYMGYVKSELLEPGQSVRGIIIAAEDDLRLRQALRVVPMIDFYRYKVSFSLIPVGSV